MNLLLDSWAILEFFRGTERGRRVAEEVKRATAIYTTVLNLYEAHYRVHADEGLERAAEAMEFIENRVVVLDIGKTLALAASEIHTREKLGAMDAFTLAAARAHDARVVTWDPDFKGLRDAVYLGE